MHYAHESACDEWCLAQALEVNKLKEIKNGRLAMIAFVGFVAQHAATGKVRHSNHHCISRVPVYALRKCGKCRSTLSTG